MSSNVFPVFMPCIAFLHMVCSCTPSDSKTDCPFVTGTRDLYKDFKQLTKLSIDLKLGRPVSDLTFTELLIYYQTPKDLIRVSPTILISILPFANYLIFPLAYRFPKYLLCQHYWTLEQKFNFQIEEHEKRVQNLPSLFRHLQNKESEVADSEDGIRVRHMLSQLASGTHPRAEDVLLLKSHFSSSGCYGLRQLTSRHQVCAHPAA